MIEASAHAEQEVMPGRSRNQRVIICKVVVNTFLLFFFFFFDNSLFLVISDVGVALISGGDFSM
jgi:hypothetical protein